MLKKLVRLNYWMMLVEGLFAAVAPRRCIGLCVRLLPFENTGDLEPSAWYVRCVRAAGVGMLAMGGIGLLLETRAAEDAAEPESSESAEPIAVETDGDAD